MYFYLNTWGRDIMCGLPSILLCFLNEFNEYDYFKMAYWACKSLDFVIFVMAIPFSK